MRNVNFYFLCFPAICDPHVRMEKLARLQTRANVLLLWELAAPPASFITMTLFIILMIYVQNLLISTFDRNHNNIILFNIIFLLIFHIYLFFIVGCSSENNCYPGSCFSSQCRCPLSFSGPNCKTSEI